MKDRIKWKIASIVPDSGFSKSAVNLHNVSFIRSGQASGTKTAFTKRFKPKAESFFIVLEPRLGGYNFPRQTVSFVLTEDEPGGVNTVKNCGQGQKPHSKVCDGNKPDPKFFPPLNRPE